MRLTHHKLVHRLYQLNHRDHGIVEALPNALWQHLLAFAVPYESPIG